MPIVKGTLAYLSGDKVTAEVYSPAGWPIFYHLHFTLHCVRESLIKSKTVMIYLGFPYRDTIITIELVPFKIEGKTTKMAT